jgi:predicted ATPase
MDRALPIYEMAEGADPDVLERSRLVAEPFALVYATQRARRAVGTKTVLYDPDEVL